MIEQPRESDALPLAAGQDVVPLEVPGVEADARHAPVDELSEARRAEALLHSLVFVRDGVRVDPFGLAAPGPLGEGDVGVDNLVAKRPLQQVRTLGQPHHDLAAVVVLSLGGRHVPLDGLPQSREHAEQRRLARSVRARDEQVLAGTHDEGHVLDEKPVAGLLGRAHGDAVERDGILGPREQVNLPGGLLRLSFRVGVLDGPIHGVKELTEPVGITRELVQVSAQ